MGQLTAYDKFVQQALKHGFSLFGLPPTAQTVSYRTGDDGDLEKGYPRIGPRFVDNGDGTVTDKATGLMWAQSGIGKGCFYGGKKNWAGAIDWANALDFAGHTDWRLPNIKELISILDYSTYSPAINETVFPHTANSDYWSSTTYNPLTDRAFYIYMLVPQMLVNLKTVENYVRAVRLGYPA